MSKVCFRGFRILVVKVLRKVGVVVVLVIRSGSISCTRVVLVI